MGMVAMQLNWWGMWRLWGRSPKRDGLEAPAGETDSMADRHDRSAKDFERSNAEGRSEK